VVSVTTSTSSGPDRITGAGGPSQSNPTGPLFEAFDAHASFTTTTDLFGVPSIRQVRTTGGLDSVWTIPDLSVNSPAALRYGVLWTHERETSATDRLIEVVVTGASPGVPIGDAVTGTAAYSGATRGLYRNAGGSLFRTASDATLTMNFATAQVSGATSNFRFVDANGAAASLPDQLNFSFSGAWQYFHDPFPATTAGGLNGRVQALFFGPRAQEAGLAYAFGDAASAGPFMTGAGLLGASDPPDPVYEKSGCASTPYAIACQGANQRFQGPSAIIRAVVPSGASATLTTSLRGLTRDVEIQRDNRSQSNLSVTVDGQRVGTVFPGIAAGSDVLGPFEAKVFFDGASLYYFDVSSALSGSLDYMLLAGFEDEGLVNDVATGFAVFGRPTASMDMPTTGSATFVGGTRGVYVRGGTSVFATASDVSMSANFSAGTVAGQTSNFRFMNTSNGALTTLSDKLDFRFDATINGGFFSGAATMLPGSVPMAGGIEGAFYGPPGAAPEEAGFAYRLENAASGNYIVGGAALGRQ